MAFPVVASSAVDSGTGTSHVIDIPARSAGDIVVLYYAGAFSPGLPSTLGGVSWTQLATAGDGTVWWLRAANSTGTTVMISGVSGDFASVAVRITGASSSIAPEIASASSSSNPPALNPAAWGTEDTLWLTSSSSTFNTVTAVPASYTQIANQSPGNPVVAVARRNNTVASEDPGAFTSDFTGFVTTIGVPPSNVTSNTVPTADAGPDQAVHYGDTVALDGTGSTDAEGSLTYAWTVLDADGTGLVNGDITNRLTSSASFVAAAPLLPVSITQVQKKADTSGKGFGAPSLTFDTPPTEGNLLVAVAGGRDNLAAPAGFSSAVVAAAPSADAIYYKVAGPGESSAVTFSAGGWNTGAIYEFASSTGWPANPLGVTASSAEGNTPRTTGTTSTTTAADALAIAAWGSRSGQFLTRSYTNGFTEGAYAHNGDGATDKGASASATKVLTSTQTVETAVSWTSGSTTVRGAMAVFSSNPPSVPSTAPASVVLQLQVTDAGSLSDTDTVTIAMSQGIVVVLEVTGTGGAEAGGAADVLSLAAALFTASGGLATGGAADVSSPVVLDAVTGSGGPMVGTGTTATATAPRQVVIEGSRRFSFRYELLDGDNNFKGDLENVTAGSIEHNWLADIKRTGRFTLRDSGGIDFLSDRIKPYIRLHLPPYGPNDFVEWPQGVFLLSSPSRSADATSAAFRDVEAYDAAQVYSDDLVVARYTVDAGDRYTDAVSDLLGDVPKNITASTSTLPTAREWEPGTSKLKIINELLGSVNYESLSFDEEGVAIVRPYMSPADRSSEYTYADDDVSVLLPEITQEFDLFSIPNRWVLVVSEPDRAPLTATYTNSNAASPTSTVRRGRTIVDFRTEQDAADQAALDDKVSRLAFEASQVYEAVEFETGLMPIHSGNDVYRVEFAPLALSAKYSEHTWSLQLSVGATMRHRARRVVTV